MGRSSDARLPPSKILVAITLKRSFAVAEVWPGAAFGARMVALANSKTLTFLSILIVTLSIVLQALAPDFVGTIGPASVGHEQGLAYTVELKKTSPSAFWNFAAGDNNSGSFSKLVLFEDGQQLHQAHASHDDIRLLGKGRYSHWGSYLFFSSTDATAPSGGLHVYSFRVPQRIPAWLWVGALGCTVILLFQGLFGSRSVSRVVIVASIIGVLIYFVFLASVLWGSWALIDLQPDSKGYLVPAATALFEGHWLRASRPFGYSLLAYKAIKLGGSLHALVLTQLVLYVTASLLLYTAIFVPLFASFNLVFERVKAVTVAHIFAAATVLVYFLLSSYYLSTVFYVAPELVSSVTALSALSLCLILLINNRHPLVISAAFALAAAACAALLVGFKPSMSATAGLTLVLAACGLVLHRRNLSRLGLGLVLATMLAMPTAVLVVDGYFARKYHDTSWDLFGPVTAFCNNAPLIADNLQTPDSAGNRLLGKTGASEVAAFLRAVMNQPDGGYRIEGYNGDGFCVYNFGEWRSRLENKYFGANTQEVARTYRWLIIGSILEAPGSYAKRVLTQMKAYVTRKQMTCGALRQQQRNVTNWSVVDRLVAKYGLGPTDQSFPSTPGADSVCGPLAQMVNGLQLPVISVAVILALISCVWRRSRQREASPGARAVLLSTGFWLSGAIIVALTETFDVYRYVTVMFPVFIATFAIAIGHIVEMTASYVQSRLGLARCAQVERAGFVSDAISPR